MWERKEKGTTSKGTASEEEDVQNANHGYRGIENTGQRIDQRKEQELRLNNRVAGGTERP